VSSRFLPTIGLNAFYENEELLPVMTSAAGASLREALRFSTAMRRRGIVDLLTLGSAATFDVYLHKSGRAFLHFLQGAPDEIKVTSRADPFFDAVACLDVDCARGIAGASRRAWNEQLEYEDDFLYATFLMSAFFLGAQAPDLQAMLARYEAVLEGRDDARLELCNALLAADAGRFDAALGQLLDERDERYQRLVERGSVLEEESATEGKICVEGLALVRLAEQRALATRKDYLFVPSLARAAPLRPYLADDWKKIDE
jgi:Immunity protein 49